MFKQSAKKIWMPAVSIVAIAIVAVAAIAGSSHVRARSARTSATQVPASAAQSGRVRADLDALPLAFEANQGQTDPQVKYMARGKGYTAFLTADETVFAMQSPRANAGITGKGGLLSAHKTDKATKDETAAIRMKLVGANENAPIAAENELPGHSNYFIGNDRTKWHAGVKQYARVSYNHVYPGVNLAFHGQQKQLEFDFIVAPGADPKSIRFDVAGAKKISTDSAGNLVLASAVGDVVLHKPVTYQSSENTRQVVDSRFVVAKNTVSFQVGNYDRRRELVIDPAVSYATFLGGSKEDDAYGIAVDSSGNAYVTGQTASADFPGASNSYKSGFDVFVTKISSDGTTLEYSTYVGGSVGVGGGAADDSGNAIAIDSLNVYVAGGTSSLDFPAGSTPGYQPAFGGGTLDAFVFELASNGGSLVFSSYLGGTGDDVAYGVAVDPSGIYIAGTTGSGGLGSAGVKQLTKLGSEDGFVAKLSSANTRAYFTYLGAGGESLTGLAIDGSGHAYVTGATLNASFPVSPSAFQKTCVSCPNSSDAFVSVLLPDASDFVYSTFLGGSDLDQSVAIAVDGSGDAYVTGVTKSSNFPPKPNPPLKGFVGTQNAFVTEFNPTGGLVYSTYLGGSTNDMGTGIAVDSNKNAFIVGRTNSSDFPTAGATQGTLKGGYDAFVSEIGASGSALLFSTFLGGTQDDNTSATGNLTGTGAIAVDPAGTNIYVASNTSSSDFPTTTGAKQSAYAGNIDGYVAKFSNTGFSITNGALSPASGHAGVAANATITVASTGGFAGQVQLACSVSPTPAKGPTCTLSPTSVTLAANGSPQNATLSVATAVAAARLENPFDRRGGVLFATILPVFGLTLLGAGLNSPNSRRKKLFGLLLLGMLAMSLMLMPACSSSSTTVGGGGGGGTPTGAYTITVTGTSGGATATGSPAITLTIN
ncbi:MAG: SBBP repeat-containing protein [Candidatus Sulfotelmatobacter sp.]